MVKESNKSEGAEKNNGGMTPPSIALPKGGGAIHGIGEKFAANPVTGTGSMTIPISVSPGRSGFAPQLSLSYDSGSGNGPFGFGWSLSIPAITRKTDKGLPRYDDPGESDVYILSGAEDLVPVLKENGDRFEDPTTHPGFVIHRYRPRIEGLFARIERWTDSSTGAIHWRSISRDNITTWYGKTEESRIYDPDDPGRVFTWLICESYDDKGNAVVYDYVGEDSTNVDHSQACERNRVRTANRYLKGVKYGNVTSRLANPDLTRTEWLFEVVFDYDEGRLTALDSDPTHPEAEQHRYVEASIRPARGWPVRPDPFSSHRAGFEVRTYRRCNRVLMFHRFSELGPEPCLVMATEFDYRDLDYTKPAPVETELAHEGSTRFASFLCSVTRSGFVRDETKPLTGVDGATVTYLKKSWPPLEFEYTKAEIQEDIRELDSVSLENVPAGLDGARYQWLDLDGEGISGIFSEQAGAWYYKPNLGGGRFGGIQALKTVPAGAGSGEKYQFVDLAGDGRLDAAQFGGASPGFYERTYDQLWEPFTKFRSLPNIDWSDPNLRFVDLTGDGRADILITEDDKLTWLPSLAEEGFGEIETARQFFDEEKGPRLVFADGEQSVYLADMCGDGLTDFVRIRNGEICYWPNLGYGRFGAKVTMDNAPWFDSREMFDQKRIRLADVDGSGTNDIIYFGSDGARIYFNQSGNRWSEARRLNQFPVVDDLSSIATADLLGNGTACLVWSSASPAEARRPVRFIDLMGGRKPHLLVKSVNNLGAETHVQYVASTKFYLEDKLSGKPWITRLPFPVHVVERVETLDRITRNRFVTRYAYHHGYFDGVEREFRGFGLVEQWDTEEFAALTVSGELPAAANIDEQSHVPPMLTRTWFHTGFRTGFHTGSHAGGWGGAAVSKQFERDYYREGDASLGIAGLTDGQLEAMLLDDTVLPDSIKMPDGTQKPWVLSSDEAREACRALKGSILREEVYALDGTEKQDRPYSASERNYTIEFLQPLGFNQHAVFSIHARETIDFHYERELFDVGGTNVADPRVTHAMTLAADAYGNVLKSTAISYGRRHADPDPLLTNEERQQQLALFITTAENDYTEAVATADEYRAPLPAEARTYQIYNVAPDANQQDVTNLFRFEEIAGKLKADGGGLPEAPYEDLTASSIPGASPRRRIIERVRTLYRKDDLSGPLDFLKMEPRALPFESYKLAFTPGLLATVYKRTPTGKPAEDLIPRPADVPRDQGGYVDLLADGAWWIPSGRVFFHPDASLNPDKNKTDADQELAHARAHFFLPHRFQDPFLNNTIIGYDTSAAGVEYNLLAVSVKDAAGNEIKAKHDYRVLQPREVADPNRNRSQVAFDALGMVVGTAVMGKEGEALGDLLTDFEADLVDAVIEAHFSNPFTNSHDILKQATTRLVYDLDRYRKTAASPEPRPSAVYTMARETHESDLASGEQTKIQHSFSYSDGFGREIQKKLQAEPEPVPRRDPDGHIKIVDAGPVMTGADASPRWVGSGWTVFNNKGKPVRQYEPFFTDRHDFEFEVKIGVSPVLFYDSADRVVGTLRPDHTWEKIVFDPWKQVIWDLNDTVSLDPKNDSDLSQFLLRLPDSDYLPTWHDFRIDPSHSTERAKRWPDSRDRDAEAAAAVKAAIHAGTPAVAYFDSLGRTFLAVAHNKFKLSSSPPGDPPVEEFHKTRTIFDIEKNHREVVDARGIVVMRYDYDMLSNNIHQKSPDAGERWTLNDVAGKPLYSWDSRDQKFRTAYDQLRRPVGSYLTEGASAEAQITRTVYGEGRTDAEAKNLRGKPVEVSDQAGVVTTDLYDFKGNLLRSRRRLAQEYKKTLDWTASVPLETATYSNTTRYDALNRPAEMTTPDNSIIGIGYNEANFIERIEARLRGATTATPFVSDIDYDAKGRRTLVAFGNKATTSYEYDPETFRLTDVLTIRSAADFPEDCPNPAPADWPGCQVQNLHYTYDPAGNITSIRDDAQQKVYFKNVRVEPNADYTYDAIYRLIEAAGREFLGTASGPTPPDAFNSVHIGLDRPNAGTLGRYAEQYVYDAVGNILNVRHRGSDPTNAGWKRCYQYATNSNRLLSTSNPADPHKPDDACARDYSDAPFYAEKYEYDEHGNITRMPQLPVMQWDYQDQLRASSKQSVTTPGVTPVTTWYVYDTAGQRVRKVTESEAIAPAAPVRTSERIYLGGFEVYREYNGGGAAVKLERETLHMMDDKQRIALVETRVDTASPEQLIRYQFGNHLGSASLELDDRARIISYEEHYPYGGASYQAVRSKTEAPKRYRFTGKERDEESGLYYHGARYYAPWLGRWISADPKGPSDGPNLFAYCGNNPIIFRDPSGTTRSDVTFTEGDVTNHPDAHVVVGDPHTEAAKSTESAKPPVKDRPETWQEKYKRNEAIYRQGASEPKGIDTIAKGVFALTGLALGGVGFLAEGAGYGLAALKLGVGVAGATAGGELASRAAEAVIPNDTDPNVKEFGKNLAEFIGGGVGGALATRGVSWGRDKILNRPTRPSQQTLDEVRSKLPSRNREERLPAQTAQRYLHQLERFNKLIFDKSGNRVTDIDVGLKRGLRRIFIEVTAKSGSGKAGEQIPKLREHPLVNPRKEPVIVFGTKLGGQPTQTSLENAGAYVARTFEELDALIEFLWTR